MVPALAFAEPQTQTPQAGVHPGAVAGWVSLVLGAASIATGTGFGIDLAVHSPARRFDEPLVTGVLLGAGVLLAAVGLYLILDDLLSSLTDAVFRR
jgi:hypothetical protein